VIRRRFTDDQPCIRPMDPDSLQDFGGVPSDPFVLAW
jgi:hypothetical protein